MRVDRRALAVFGLVAVSAAGLLAERQQPAWIRKDPLLQPFGHGDPPSDASAAKKDRERTPVPVILADATVDELVLLPGIGPKTAARIVAWRDTTGTVDRVDRLREVRGIGPAKLEALRPWVLLAPPGDSLRLDEPSESP